jgi:hypothetical protein
MAEGHDRFFRGLDALKTIVGIVAVLVGGYWTYSKFISTEAPLYEPNITVTRSLSAPVRQGEDCIRDFGISVENTGKSVVTITRVVTRGWKFFLQRDQEAFAALVDLDKIEIPGLQIVAKEFPDPAVGTGGRWYPLLGKLRTGEKTEHSFTLLFKNEAGTWIYLKSEIFVEGEAKPKIGGMWDRVCGG